MDKLLQKTYEIYGLNRTEYSRRMNIPYKTLERWDIHGISPQGKLLIQAHIDIQEQKLKYEKKIEEYQEEVEEYKKFLKVLKSIKE